LLLHSAPKEKKIAQNSNLHHWPNIYEPDDRIVGGKVADPFQFPLTVSFKKNKETSSYHFYIFGAIIGEEWILTAAHCVYNLS